MLISAFLIGIVTSIGWWTGEKITDKIESVTTVVQTQQEKQGELNE